MMLQIYSCFSCELCSVMTILIAEAVAGRAFVAMAQVCVRQDSDLPLFLSPPGAKQRQPNTKLGADDGAAEGQDAHAEAESNT